MKTLLTSAFVASFLFVGFLSAGASAAPAKTGKYAAADHGSKCPECIKRTVVEYNPRSYGMPLYQKRTYDTCRGCRDPLWSFLTTGKWAHTCTLCADLAGCRVCAFK